MEKCDNKLLNKRRKYDKHLVTDGNSTKAPKNSSELSETAGDTIISNFLSWMKKQGFELSKKTQLTKIGSCSRYGLVAVDDIMQGEVLVRIPRTSLLWEKTCSISSHLSNLVIPASSGSGWVKLILCLMFEYTNTSSRWRPYMDFVPPVEIMDQPMFWNPDERKSLLGASGLDAAVNKDIASIEEEFNQIALPFIKEHSALGFDKDIHNLSLYKHMVAFVMAYSFTEPTDNDYETSPPVMVPMADVLNHVACNNAQLEFDKDYLTMVAVKDICGGKEIYNTYGQLSNSQLLHMYGFLEDYPNNVYDNVDINFSVIYQTAKDHHGSSWPSVHEKISWLSKKTNFEPDSSIVLGMKGILNYEEFKFLFKVLALSDEAFTQYKEDDEDDWDTDSSDDADESDTDEEFEVLTFSKIKIRLDSKQQNLLINVVQLALNRLNFGDKKETDSLPCNRVERANKLLYGERKILELLLNALKI